MQGREGPNILALCPEERLPKVEGSGNRGLSQLFEVSKVINGTKKKSKNEE